ncbi:hypothetical protein [Spongiactinospora gelatinilytica]|uniref:hypothetical protein n=1 Tax=Spongiactinospora gelatinilytica TaxID=2666298 RepID=UPI001314FD21|nr:hypothetical protein [Spongiactinospora gelatinilytica]
MDVQDPALRAELERRLAALARDETGDPAHERLSATNLWLLLAIVAVLTLAGWVMAG